MKKLMICTLLLVSTFAWAKEQPRTVAVVKGYLAGIDEITLLENGVMQIAADQKVVTVQLGEGTFNHINSYAINLYDAELKTIKRDKTCKLASKPSLSNLYVTKYTKNYEPTGVTRLMLTKRSCTEKLEVYPVDQFDQITAHALREQLVALALELLNQKSK